MKIVIHKEGMKFTQLIKFIGVGYFCGFGVIFFIPILLILFEAPSSSFTGNLSPIGAVLMIPVILALQAIMLSIAIAFGHWVFKRFTKLEIEYQE